MTILIFLFLFSGVLLAVLSIPMIMGKIPPNGLYGFRVKKTMEDPSIWYPANRYSGKWLLGSSIVVIISAVLFPLIPGLSIDIYAYAVLGVWLILFTALLIACFKYLKTL